MTKNVGDRAVLLFDSGYTCAESVLLALSEEFGRSAPKIIPRVATGFEVGIGRSGLTCGGLCGAVMAFGLVMGWDRAEEQDKRTETHKTALRMVLAFEEKFGTNLCRDLTGCNPRVPEGVQKYRSKKVHEKICTKLVRWCTEYAAQLMRNE